MWIEEGLHVDLQPPSGGSLKSVGRKPAMARQPLTLMRPTVLPADPLKLQTDLAGALDLHPPSQRSIGEQPVDVFRLG